MNEKKSLHVKPGKKKVELSELEERLQIKRTLKTLDYHGAKIRSVAFAGEWWIAFIDVCKIFKCLNPSREFRKIGDNEACKLEIFKRNRSTNCINRRGLLSFALFSNKAGAMEFYDWACREIFKEANERDESDSEAGCGVGSGAGFGIPASDASEVRFDIACVAAS